MELGFVICAQVAVFAAVSIVPMMILRQNAERSRARVPGAAETTARTPVRR